VGNAGVGDHSLDIKQMYIFVSNIHARKVHQNYIYIYIYIRDKYATKKIYIYKQKKNYYTRRFFAGGSLSPGILDRLSDPGEGAGVAI